MYSYFYESKKLLCSLMYRETCQFEKKRENGENIFFEDLANRFRLIIGANGRPSMKWTSWKGNDMLLKVDYI